MNRPPLPSQAVSARERAADIAADVEAGPVVDRLRRRIGRSLGIGARGQISRNSRRRERDNSGSAEQKGVESFYYDRVKDLPPLPEEGAHKLDEIWANCEYFLKAVVPVAEKTMSAWRCIPTIRPRPISRGSQQIMSTLDGWKKLVGLVNSPSNCIIFDCGVTRELGEDPVEVANWFGTRDRIGHVHSAMCACACRARTIPRSRPTMATTTCWR